MKFVAAGGELHDFTEPQGHDHLRYWYSVALYGRPATCPIGVSLLDQHEVTVLRAKLSCLSRGTMPSPSCKVGSFPGALDANENEPFSPSGHL